MSDTRVVDILWGPVFRQITEKEGAHWDGGKRVRNKVNCKVLGRQE